MILTRKPSDEQSKAVLGNLSTCEDQASELEEQRTDEDPGLNLTNDAAAEESDNVEETLSETSEPVIANAESIRTKPGPPEFVLEPEHALQPSNQVGLPSRVNDEVAPILPAKADSKATEQEEAAREVCDPSKPEASVVSEEEPDNEVNAPQEPSSEMTKDADRLLFKSSFTKTVIVGNNVQVHSPWFRPRKKIGSSRKQTGPQKKLSHGPDAEEDPVESPTASNSEPPSPKSPKAILLSEDESKNKAPEDESDEMLPQGTKAEMAGCTTQFIPGLKPTGMAEAMKSGATLANGEKNVGWERPSWAK